jgi:VPDSG-CTERM motif
MKNNMIKLAGVAAVAIALSQTIQAASITGNIGFNGNAVLDTTSANTASQVVSWNTSTVGGDSGTFATAGVAANSIAQIFGPFNFNSSTPMTLWTVGGSGGVPLFTFTLGSSSIFFQGGGFVNVIITGTVSAIGYDATAFTGTFSVSNPSQNGTAQFSENLQFNSSSVPDGGTTVMLLGAALSGLALMKRKLVA